MFCVIVILEKIPAKSFLGALLMLQLSCDSLEEFFAVVPPSGISFLMHF